MNKYEVGKLVRGFVTGIEAYGAFVAFDEFYTGLIHISEISTGFVKNINDYFKVGDTIYVKIIEIDKENSHLKLSVKNINYKNRVSSKKKKIDETEHGFKTLETYLPIWIEKKLQNAQKN